MRPDIAASLQSIQSQLGDSLGDLLEVENSAEVSSYGPALVLEHLSGLQSGGSVSLSSGSYRFGRSSASIMFDTGKPHDPQFGLTIDPDGAVVLYPPSTGVLLDGEEVLGPQPMRLGQVITIGHNRFGLHPEGRWGTSRTSTAAEPHPPMPTPEKGRHVDQQILDWVAKGRERAAKQLWTDLRGPVEVHNRISENRLFDVVAEDARFGHVLLGMSDTAYPLPVELANANQTTREAAEEIYGRLPGAPVSIDLAKSSLALVGARDHCRAVATWIAISLVAQSAPTCLGVTVDSAGNSGAWSWLVDMPHKKAAESQKLSVTVVDQKRPDPVTRSGTVVMYDTAADVPDAVGAVLEISSQGATFTDRTIGGHNADVVEISAIGLANAVAVERSLLISHYSSASGQ